MAMTPGGFRFGAGCGPLGASVIFGAIVGFFALSWSGEGLSPAGLFHLIGGYIAGAFIAHIIVLLLGRIFGQWWRE
ncbi:MAG: hypothetical protein ACRDJH_26645 [Thermomicrobiales bacterium]